LTGLAANQDRHEKRTRTGTNLETSKRTRTGTNLECEPRQANQDRHEPGVRTRTGRGEPGQARISSGANQRSEPGHERTRTGTKAGSEPGQARTWSEPGRQANQRAKERTRTGTNLEPHQAEPVRARTCEPDGDKPTREAQTNWRRLTWTARLKQARGHIDGAWASVARKPHRSAHRSIANIGISVGLVWATERSPRR